MLMRALVSEGWGLARALMAAPLLERALLEPYC